MCPMKTKVAPSSLGQENTTTKKLYKVREVAIKAGVHPVTIRRALARGLFSSVDDFRHKLIPCDQVDRWIEGRKQGESK